MSKRITGDGKCPYGCSPARPKKIVVVEAGLFRVLARQLKHELTICIDVKIV